MKHIRKGLGILCTILWGVMCICSIGTQSFASNEDKEMVLKLHDEGKPYLYGSRYQCQLICKESGNPGEIGRIYWNAPEIFNLTFFQDGERISIPVYCLDGVAVQISKGNNFRRINLEDRVDFNDDAGGRLRAILMETFPYMAIEEISNRVNMIMGEGSLIELTQGEVIAAAQQAIWTIGNSGKYTVDRNYVSIRGISQYDLSEFVYPESLSYCVESVHTWNNIENLYRYYLELEPIGPIQEVLTAESFQIDNCEIRTEQDGTHNLYISYLVMADITESDEVYLTVSAGDQTHRRKLKQGSGSCAFLGLKEITSASVSVEGYQTGRDVYLFSTEEAGNELIGYDNNYLPVSAQFTIAFEKMNVVNELVEKDFESSAEISTFRVEADALGTRLGKMFRIFSGGFFSIAIVLVVINGLKRLLQNN